MSSIFSTQNRQTFLRRKYCFLVAIALSPPVGLWDALMGRPPPLLSAIVVALLFFLDRGDWCSGHGRAGPGCRLSGHRVFERWRRGYGYLRGRPPGSTLLASLLALLDLFHLLVDAHCNEFQHLVGNAQTPFDLHNGFGLRHELQQDIKAFGAFLHAISEFADAPFVGLVHISTLACDEGGQLFDQLIDLFFRRIRPDDE